MKQIVGEIKAIFNAAYLKHKQIVKAIAEKNFDEAKRLISEAQAQVLGRYRSIEAEVMTQYRSLETKFNAQVLPELKSAYKRLLLRVNPSWSKFSATPSSWVRPSPKLTDHTSP